MSKSKLFFMLAGFVLAAAIAIPANASKKKECGNNWDRVKVGKAKCEKEARKVDRNGNDDDWVCERYRYGDIRYRDNW
jgi:hypothetical protein